MYIESLATEFQIKLDDIHSDEELLSEISLLEDENRSLIYVTASFGSWNRLQSLFCALRASNFSAILLLQDRDPKLHIDEVEELFQFLRNWDQLFLHNILVLAKDWIPETFQERLRGEIKHELKWFREWFLACSDPKIHRYPTLPWRSYIRKVVAENYEFAQGVLRIAANGPADNTELGKLLEKFLEKKQQVLCTFPKRWGRVQ